MARKGILSTDLPTGEAKPRPPRPAPQQPRGAVGALQSSLTKLQEGAVQDIAADLVDNAGYQDRLDHDPDAHKQLVQSLKTYGQQVPVLLRPHPKTQGRYEIVYGRRRLRALKELGLPVKAMVRHLDDEALVLAQGQENTARQDLSFIEKAAFAAQLQRAGYERQTIADALSTDMPMLSRLLKVGAAFDLQHLKRIGAAPGIGRDRWMQLVKLMGQPGATDHVQDITVRDRFTVDSSDLRFEHVLSELTQRLANPVKRPAPPKPRTLRGPDGAALAEVKSSPRGVTLTVPARTAKEFGDWLNANADTVIQDLHARWQIQQAED